MSSVGLFFGASEDTSDAEVCMPPLTDAQLASCDAKQRSFEIADSGALLTCDDVGRYGDDSDGKRTAQRMRVRGIDEDTSFELLSECANSSREVLRLVLRQRLVVCALVCAVALAVFFYASTGHRSTRMRVDHPT